jgi:Multiubiquitin
MSDMPLTEEKPEKPRHTITILVNNRPVVLHHKGVTGEKIKHAAGVPANFKLFDPAGREIGDEEHIEISEGERFTAISGQDVS